MRQMATIPYSFLSPAAVLITFSLQGSILRLRPVHSIVLSLTICAAVLSLYSRYLTHTLSPRHRSRDQYEHFPQEESAYLSKATRRNSEAPVLSPSPKKTLLAVVVCTFFLISRIEVLRRISQTPECASQNLEVFLPFLLAVYDALRGQSPIRIEKREVDLDLGLYEELGNTFRDSVLGSRWRYTPSALVLSVGGFLTSDLWLSQNTNYICTIASGRNVLIPHLQVLALGLDVALCISVYELTRGRGNSRSSIASASASWSLILLLNTCCWMVIAATALSFRPMDRGWLFLTDLPSRGGFLLLVLWQGILLSSCGLSLLYSVNTHADVVHIAMMLSGLFTMTPGLRVLWSVRRPFPPLSSTALTWSFMLIIIGWSFHQKVRTAITKTETPVSVFPKWLVATILLVLLYPGMVKKDTVHFHPIDLLMYDAQKDHQKYVNLATSSTTLNQAVDTYKRRYNDNPPPGFDAWFNFTSHKTVWITDEFDQIYNDLLPFRAVSPADIRRQTWELISNPWNEVFGVRIQNGETKIHGHVPHRHQGVMEDVVRLINGFSEYLPDMDLAFNLNDEPRIALRHEDERKLRGAGLKSILAGSSVWSSDRNSTWLPQDPKPYRYTTLTDWSYHNTFQEWASTTCPSNSPAQKSLYVPSRSQFCVKCAERHSIGQFVSNWALAADACHQPDLADLHGFYISPFTFKASHSLQPIFSTSKPRGFQDILYPSVRDYFARARYEPTNETGRPGQDDYQPGFPDLPFSQKENTMYWRGGTGEGSSAWSGVWPGLTRQRFVHMTNNVTMHPHDRVTLLLPNQNHPERYTYTTLPGPAVASLGLATDVQFVGHVDRCGGADCLDQQTEFGIDPQAPLPDFQTHWKYRFLFDLDGAGASGNFIPFLQSRSLPFKAALFREWYDSRLTPWLHFVPQDIRLHGFWSTLAYFAGVDGTTVPFSPPSPSSSSSLLSSPTTTTTDGHDATDEEKDTEDRERMGDAERTRKGKGKTKGRRIKWAPHSREAELIAEAGRDWAAKVLTKADMEVYFFRLLLEWARLVDDDRDDLGFVLES